IRVRPNSRKSQPVPPSRSRKDPAMKHCVRVLVLLLGCAAPALADDWPAWRGPFGNGQSSEKDLPLTWSATEKVRWKAELPDAGNSTPVVWGKRVFVTQASDKVDWPPMPRAGGPASAYRRAVLCFDRTNGKQLWKQEVIYKDKESTHPDNP